jgi:hypothetical protein
MALATAKNTKTPEWKRLFNESWRIIRENRTSGPTTTTSTPFNHVTVNEGQLGNYRVRLRVQSSPYSAKPTNYIATIYRGKSKKELVEIHSEDGVWSGKEEVIPDLLEEFGDTGFDPFGKDATF